MSALLVKTFEELWVTCLFFPGGWQRNHDLDQGSDSKIPVSIHTAPASHHSHGISKFQFPHL